MRLQNPPSHSANHTVLSQSPPPRPTWLILGPTAEGPQHRPTEESQTKTGLRCAETSLSACSPEHLNKKPTLLGSSQNCRESQSARDIRKFTGASAGWEAAGRTKQGRPPQLSPPAEEEPQERRGSVQTQVAQGSVHTANPHFFSHGHSDTVHRGALHLSASNFWNLL